MLMSRCPVGFAGEFFDNPPSPEDGEDPLLDHDAFGDGPSDSCGLLGFEVPYADGAAACRLLGHSAIASPNEACQHHGFDYDCLTMGDLHLPPLYEQHRQKERFVEGQLRLEGPGSSDEKLAKKQFIAFKSGKGLDGASSPTLSCSTAAPSTESLASSSPAPPQTPASPRTLLPQQTAAAAAGESRKRCRTKSENFSGSDDQQPRNPPHQLALSPSQSKRTNSKHLFLAGNDPPAPKVESDSDCRPADRSSQRNAGASSSLSEASPLKGSADRSLTDKAPSQSNSLHDANGQRDASHAYDPDVNYLFEYWLVTLSNDVLTEQLRALRSDNRHYAAQMKVLSAKVAAADFALEDASCTKRAERFGTGMVAGGLTKLDPAAPVGPSVPPAPENLLPPLAMGQLPPAQQLSFVAGAGRPVDTTNMAFASGHRVAGPHHSVQSGARPDVSGGAVAAGIPVADGFDDASRFRAALPVAHVFNTHGDRAIGSPSSFAWSGSERGQWQGNFAVRQSPQGGALARFAPLDANDKLRGTSGSLSRVASEQAIGRNFSFLHEGGLAWQDCNRDSLNSSSAPGWNGFRLGSGLAGPGESDLHCRHGLGQREVPTEEHNQWRGPSSEWPTALPSHLGNSWERSSRHAQFGLFENDFAIDRTDSGGLKHPSPGLKDRLGPSRFRRPKGSVCRDSSQSCRYSDDNDSFVSSVRSNCAEAWPSRSDNGHQLPKYDDLPIAMSASSRQHWAKATGSSQTRLANSSLGNDGNVVFERGAVPPSTSRSERKDDLMGGFHETPFWLLGFGGGAPSHFVPSTAGSMGDSDAPSSYGMLVPPGGTGQWKVERAPDLSGQKHRVFCSGDQGSAFSDLFPATSQAGFHSQATMEDVVSKCGSSPDHPASLFPGLEFPEPPTSGGDGFTHVSESYPPMRGAGGTSGTATPDQFAADGSTLGHYGSLSFLSCQDQVSVGQCNSGNFVHCHRQTAV